jgi:AcrR family transcriptional regulator
MKEAGSNLYGGVFMGRPRSNIAALRRAQIVEAASQVITEEGIQALSLSAIEKRTGLARGQLTYYFKTKEEILLAVFDRVLRRMHERLLSDVAQGRFVCPESGWEWVCSLLRLVLSQPQANPEFSCLQYTFLAQMSHREDFRQRLATLYESWRANLSLGLAQDQARGLVRRQVSPRAVATLVQALLHGLSVQAVADPAAFDRQELLHLCLDLLGSYLGVTPGRRPARRRERQACRRTSLAGSGGAS